MVRGAAWLALLIVAFTGTPGRVAGQEPGAPPHAAEAEEPPASTAPSVEGHWLGLDVGLGADTGLVVEGPDGESRFHLGGVAALDYVEYDDRNVRDSGLRFDRAVVRIDGAWRAFEWRVAPDLKGIDTRGGFDEAWVAFTPAPYFRLGAGLMDLPITVEHTVPEEDLPFVGYAFPAYLDDRTDLALRVEGEVEDGLFSYDLAATAGEGSTRLGERVSGNRFSARGVLFPFRKLDWSVDIEPLRYRVPLLSGLFFSIGASHTEDFEGPLEVASPFRNELFKVGRFDASESDFLAIGYGGDFGPFHLEHEFIRGGYRNVDTPAGEETLDDQVTAWSAMFSWMVTGEHYDSRPSSLRQGRFRTPPRDPVFWSERAGPGAVELAVRYSNGDVDRDFFTFGMTSFTQSSQEFRAFSGAVNWYPTRNLRASFQIVRIIADQDPNEFERGGRDTSVLFRLQYAF